jgi:hypothetical protein
MTVFIMDSRDILAPIGFHVIDLLEDLNGLPKIALRKSGMKMLEKICGLRLD